MSGYLKSSEGLFRLSRKVTTVGRENCHLIVTSSPVDSEHALIEYKEGEGEGLYYLQDLSSTQGTYINGSKITTNVPIQLNHSDAIRFGGSSTVYEFGIDGHTKLTISPSSPATTTTEVISHIQEFGKQSSTAANNSGYNVTNPHQHTPTPPGCLKYSKPAPTNVTNDGQRVPGERSLCFGQVPPPEGYTIGQWSGAEPNRQISGKTSVRFRPQSAGPKNRVRNHPSPKISVSTNNLCETLGSSSTSSSRISSYKTTNNQSYSDLQIQLRQLNEELRRAAAYEAACKQKDELANQLRNEISTLQHRLRHSELNLEGLSQAQIHQSLAQLEKDVTSKKLDAHNLRQKLSKMRPDPPAGRSHYHARCADHAPTASAPLKPLHVPPVPSTPCVTCQGVDIGGLKFEIELLRKQISGSSRRITDMQKDMTNKDRTIGHLTKEIENLKKELQSKINMIFSLEAAVKRAEDGRNLQEELQMKDLELVSVRNKLKNLEDNEAILKAEVSTLKADLEYRQQTENSNQSTISKLKSEFDDLSTKYRDLERNDRAVRVSLEQSIKRLEKMRAAVIQSSFSSQGTRSPNKQLSDEELIVALKNMHDEKTELKKQIKELSQSSAEKRIVENMKSAKQSLSASVDSSPKRK